MNSLRSVGATVRPQLPALAGFAAPFVLIVYLALESGGYDLISRSQVGIVVWWAVLLGIAGGLLPVIRLTRSGWIVLGVLAALTVWTALAALTWTQSTERSVIEVGRVVTLLGFLLILLLIQGKDGLRRSVAAVGAAVALVAVVALASRYHPGWFNIGELPDNYPKGRLNFPLGYWNGLAALMAMGLAALLWSATYARTAIGRALACGAVPLIIFTCYLTASRGGAIGLLLSVAVMFVLFPRRLVLLLTMLLPVLGSVALIALLSQRPELRDNLGGVAGSQGNEMTWMTIVIVLLVIGVTYLFDTKVIGRLVRIPEVSRTVTTRIGVVIASVLAILVLASLVSGYAVDRFNAFKQPFESGATVDRLSTINSGERYQQWASAVDAGKSEVLTGIGPGAYEYWWSRNGDGPGFVRDAHSLYLEGFAELGIIGFLLVVALVLVPILIAVAGAARPGRDDRRPLYAASAAGMVAFAVAAGIDWAWEMTVLPATFLVYVAAIAGPDAETRRGRRHSRTFRLPFSVRERAWIAAGSVVAVVVIAVPLVGTQLVRDSQTLYREGDLVGSIDKAKQARNVQPWSSTASIQLALLEAQAGNGDEALDAARDAADQDPYSWKAWLVLAQVAEQQGKADEAAKATEKVNQLNREYSQ